MDRVLKTKQLDLIALSAEIHQAMLEEQFEYADTLLGAHGLEELPLPPRIIELRLHQLNDTPILEDWLLRAVVLRDTQEVIGNIGFHSTPDPSYLLEQGLEGLEFGYSIIERFQRNGYAREASIVIMEWAKKQHHVQTFILSIGLQNDASNALARSLGFTIHSNYEHPDRGPEYIYTKTNALTHTPQY